MRVSLLAKTLTCLILPVATYGLSVTEAQKIALDAYIYGYPLMTSEITREAFVNTAAPNPETLQAPMNQFVKQPAYPPATYQGVTAPNADTLYSAAFFDVTKEPLVFSYPDMKDRYFLFPIYDMWTEVITSPGTRTTGSAGKNILITGPGWHGAVPAGMTQVKMPTAYGWILGRTYSSGTKEDLDQVHKLQAQFNLVPLSSFGKSYTPPENKIDANAPSNKEKVRDILLKMNTQTYFSKMAELMKANPPVLPRDASIVAQMAKIGLVAGKAFDISKLSPTIQKKLADIGKTANDELQTVNAKPKAPINGWIIAGATGQYGKNYFYRAAVSAYGWGANLSADAVYPYTLTDSSGTKLTGAHTYRLHFAKGQIPPTNGFWSITMYDKEFYFYPNALNKLTVSPRDNLKYNADGSLDLYFSHTQPENVVQSNWLPAPADDFILMMRLYWPKEKAPSILPPGKGTWKPPVVEKVG